MATENTSGAVHLTSLDLDISKLQEQIKAIQQEMDALATSVEKSGYRIKESLNLPNDDLTLRFNTDKIEEDLQKAKKSVNSFKENYVDMTNAVKGSIQTPNLDRFIDELKLSGQSSDTLKKKLQDLYNLFENVQKIEVSTSNGDLYKARVTATDEYGKSIQRVVDLTKDLVDKNSILSTKVVQTSKDGEKYSQERSRSLEEEATKIQAINEKYNILKSTMERLSTSMSDNDYKSPQMDSMRESAEKLSRMIAMVSAQVGNGKMSAKSADSIYKMLSSTVNDLRKEYASLTNELDKNSNSYKNIGLNAGNEADKLKIIADKYSALKETLNGISESISNIGVDSSKMDSLSDRATKLSESIDTATQSMENGAKTSKEANELYKTISSSVSELRKEFINTSNEMEKNDKASQKREQDLAKEADALKILAGRYETFKESMKSFGDTLSTSKIKTPETESIKKEYEEIARQVDEVSSKIDKGELSARTANEYYRLLSTSLSGLKKSYQIISNEVEKSDVEFDNNVKTIENLIKKFSAFSVTLQKSKLNKEDIEPLKIDTSQIEQDLKKLNLELLENKTSFDDASALCRKYDTFLTNMKITLDDLNRSQEIQNNQMRDQGNIENAIKNINQLTLAYSRFNIQLSSSKLGDDLIGGLAQDTVGAENRLKAIADELKNGTISADQASKAYSELRENLERNKIAFSDIKASIASQNDSFSEMGKSIKSAISELKFLEKDATFKKQKKETKELRTEFQRLYEQIKNGNINVDNAREAFANLESQMDSLKQSVRTGQNLFTSFAENVTDFVKFGVANVIGDVASQAMREVADTIIQTENAVIDLRRVLTDAPTESIISKELYKIAYDYGQTFDAVQETALKFAQTGMSWNDTIEATRVTMLGLNTAELDVSNATEGLIAVMAQFNIEAEDLENVVDKINITADNFPVTSQKIVAALQRAGGTASAFGMTLEETIGIITALSEATGRAGEAIGTSLNSLITFSMKGSSLEQFSEFLGKDVSNYGVVDLWKELSEQINNSGNDLARFMSQNKEFAGLMNEELASAIGLTEEFEKAQIEQNEAIARGQDIYSTVGTYRQNYFIALLKNIDTAIAAIEKMDESMGYSERENETAMQALTKKWNQLVNAFGELAVQFGEAGFLDILKLFVNIGTETLRLTKNIGGLNTVISALIILLVNIQATKVNDKFNKIAQSVATAAAKVPQLTLSFAGLGATIKATIASIGAYLTSAAGIISVVTAIVGALIFLIQKRRENIDTMKEEHRQTMDTVNAHHEENVALAKAVVNYKNAKAAYDGTNESREKMLIASGELATAMGYEEEAIESLVDEYGSLSDKLEEMSQEEITDKLLEYEEAIKAAKDDFRVYADEVIKARDSIVFFNDDLKTSKKLLKMYPESMNSIEDLTDAYEKMKDRTRELADELGEKQAVQSSEYQLLKDMIEVIEPIVQAYANAIDKADEFKSALEGTNSTINETNDNVMTGAKYLANWTKDVEALSEKYEKLTGYVDSFQSAYASIVDIMDEYNETGIMTADMLQTLLSLEPEYLQMLNFKTDAIGWNEEAVNSLIGTNDNYMIQLAAIRVEEYANEVATRINQMAIEDLTAAEIVAQFQTMALTSEVAQAAAAFIGGADDGTQLANAIYNVGVQSGQTAAQLAALTEVVMSYASAVQSAYGAAGIAIQNTTRNYNTSYKPRAVPTRTYYTPKTSKSSGSGSKKSGGSNSKTEKDPREEELKKQKESMDNLIDSYEHAIFLLEKNSRNIDKKAKSAMDDAVNAYNNAIKGIMDKGIDLSRTIYGNIDINSRQMIEWTEKNLNDYKTAIESWGMTLEQMKNSPSAIFGNFANYSGIDVAFTPVLQTENGPVLLSRETVNKYIFGLIEKAGEDGEIGIGEMLQLDTQGIEVDGQVIKNILADVGETAEQTGQALSSIGDIANIKELENAIKNVTVSNKTSTQQIIQLYKEMQQELHKQADKYRDMGEKEDSKYITDLQKKWWDYQDEIEELMKDLYEETIEAHENALSLLERNYDRAERRLDFSYMTDNLAKQLNIQKQIQQDAHNEAQRLRALGVDENDEAIQACIDAWWDAEDAINEINDKIRDSILDTYDDFIDMADKFDVWDYLDFSKLEYLEMEVREINDLLSSGIISLKEYNEQLKELTYAMFEARKEELEKEQDEVQKKADELVSRYEKEKEILEKEKDDSQKYWDDLIAGYEKEIDVWEKRKDEAEKYYDKLIENLRKVEKQNDRINKQIDYYNSRQKIITNIEQAQARSGVEWREKEIEYQQELAELDQEWMRQLQEWDIEDQIERLELLKQMALDDFDLTISKIKETIDAANEAADAAAGAIEQEIQNIEDMIKATEEAAEEEIANIEEQIKELSRKIAEAIKAATNDGLVNSQEEFNKAIQNVHGLILNEMGELSPIIANSATETSNMAYDSFRKGFIDPSKNSATELADSVRNSLVNGIGQAATDALTALRENLINPMKQEMANLASEAKKSNEIISSKGSSSGGISSSKTKLTSSSNTKNNVISTQPTIKKPTVNTNFSMENTGTKNAFSKKDYLLNSVNNPFKSSVTVNIVNNNNGLSQAKSNTQKAIQSIFSK